MAVQIATPAFAQGVTPDAAAAAANRPSVGAAQNGVPTVNIVRPNSSGLSHNKYFDYNVDQRGLILNNSRAAGRSVQGGILLANPNLAGGQSARVILNEVTSTNRSVLSGYTEVFGTAADVIVANPNGITCDGCGFINTPRATLTTGTPVLDPTTNALMGLSVNQGVIDVGALGLDASTVDYFDIVSRSVLINGVIQGRDVGVYAGRNNFDYIARNATAMSTDAAGKPEFGIDSSLLGGMYAGRIKLVGTEKGVGVRTPPKMAASAGGMTITADGRLVMRGTVAAKQRVAAKSAASRIEVEGSVFSDESVALDAFDSVALAANSLVASARDVDITAHSGGVDLAAGAKAVAGLDAQGNLGDSGRLRIAAATQLNAVDAFLGAGSALDLAASDIDVRRAVGGDAANVRSNGTLSVAARSIRAANGKLSARGTMALTSADHLALEGGILVAAQDFTLAAQSFTADAEVSAAGAVSLAATGGDARVAGRFIGSSLDIVASGAVDASGELASLSALQVTAGSTLRSSGNLAANTQIALMSGATLSNFGEISAQGDVAFTAGAAFENGASGRVLSNGAVAVEAASRIANAGTLSSVDGTTITATATDASLENSGRIVSDERVALTSAGSVSNSGEIATLAGVDVTAAQDLSNAAAGSIAANGLVDLAATSGTLTQAGTISTASGATLSAGGALNSSGTLTANGAVTASAGGALANTGTLSSRTSLALAAGGTLSNAADGLLNGGTGPLTITAADIANAGRLGTHGDLTLTTLGDIENRGLVYSGGNAQFVLDGALTNIAADIIVEGNLGVGGLSSARAGEFRNTSGLVEAAGDVTIRADALINEAPAPIVTAVPDPTQSVSTDTGYFRTGSRRRQRERTTRTVTVEEAEALAPSQLFAGGNMVLDFGTAVNDFSQIAASGDIAASGGTLTNTGRDLIETTTDRVRTTRQFEVCDTSIFGVCIDWDWETTSDTTATNISTRSIGAVFGTIEAGGTVTANLDGHLANEAVRDGAGQVGLTSGDFAAAAAASGSTGAAAGPSSVSPDDLAAGPIAALAGRDQLFATNPDPEARYLIETRREFIDPGLFFGSDWFLAQAGFDPDGLNKRLGDAYLEDRLVREQIFKLTGKRYLAGATTDLELVKQLYANAIVEQRALNLSPGVALSAEQVGALTRDIVWLEPITVNGQSVLAPRVYLAASRPQGYDVASARITASDVAIAAGSLANSGAIRASLDLAISAGEVSNIGGLLGAGQQVAIVTPGLFANLSGEVSGARVAIAAGDILNSTVVTRDGDSKTYFDRLHQTGRIVATDDVTLTARGDILSEGGQILAGGDIAANAGGSIVLQAVAAEMAIDAKGRGWFDRQRGVSNTPGRIEAGGDVTLNAGDSIGLQGFAIKAGGDIDLMAANGIAILAASDTYERDAKAKGEGGLFGTDWSLDQQAQSVKAIASTLEAGNSLAIVAGRGDVVLDAAKLKAGGEIALSAEQGKVAMLTETDASFAQEKSDVRDLFWFETRDHGEYAETVRHVEITAGGGLKITAGEGVIAEYKATGSLDASIAQLAQTPELAWLAQVRSRPDVDWKGVNEAFDKWDYKAEGLTEAGAAIIAIAVTAVTAGAFSSFAAAFAGAIVPAGTGAGAGASVAINAAVKAGIQAGLTSIATQASISLINKNESTMSSRS